MSESYHWYVELLRNGAWILVVMIVVLIFYGRKIARVIERMATDSFELGVGPVNLKLSESKDYAEGNEGDESSNLSPIRKKQFDSVSKEASEFARRGQNVAAISKLRILDRLTPSSFRIWHNIGTLLIREGKNWLCRNNGLDRERAHEYLVQAEMVCRYAISLHDSFPHGTFYNLARAQSLGGNLIGIDETLNQMLRMASLMPPNLAEVLGRFDPPSDPHIASDEVRDLPVFQELLRALRERPDLNL